LWPQSSTANGAFARGDRRLDVSAPFYFQQLNAPRHAAGFVTELRRYQNGAVAARSGPAAAVTRAEQPSVSMTTLGGFDG
jgi:hypothetical protein